MEAHAPHARTVPDGLPIYRLPVETQGHTVVCAFCRKRCQRTSGFTLVGNVLLHIKNTSCGSRFETGYLLQFGCRGPLWRPVFSQADPSTISLVKEIRNDGIENRDVVTAWQALALLLDGHPECIHIADWNDVEESNCDSTISIGTQEQSLLQTQQQDRKRKREVSIYLRNVSHAY